MLISVLLIEKCAANWNCGGWAIVILFGLILIEGVDRAFFGFIC